MEPLPIFGAVASAVQFVEFAGKLFYGTCVIYKNAKSGEETHSDVETITKSLHQLSQELAKSLTSHKATDGQFSEGKRAMQQLCKSCQGTATELIKVLEKLNSPDKPTYWSSFRKALAAVWKESEIEELQKRLDSFRQQISLHILVSVREQNESTASMQLSLGQIVQGSVDTTESLSQTLLRHVDQSTKWQARVLTAISNSRGSGNQNEDDSTFSEHLERTVATDFFSRLCSQLKYRELENRYERIDEAQFKTFEWILDPDPPLKNQNWSSFVQFLEGDQNLYWITGKAGAGKSTLMKFISDHYRTKQLLRKWAGWKSLYIFNFYFWCSGKEIQMSEEGLIRGLLYDGMQQLPKLCRTVFARRWEAFAILGDKTTWEEPWTIYEVRKAFQALIEEATKSGKVFILIDGLDEFNGTFPEQRELIKYITSLSGPMVKMCLSSRPWNVFQDAFKRLPSLRLEDLTYSDIMKYTSSKLSDDEGFAALKQVNLHAAAMLVEEITTKASGVFLWVVLVVENLLEGLVDGERLPELQRRLESLPVDLKTLFWRILHSVDFHRAAELIRIYQASEETFTLLQMSFADEHDQEFVFNMATKPLTVEQRESTAEIMKRRLNACCKGLLEPRRGVQSLADAEIDYLHRTVKDFLRQADVWPKFLESTPHFDPSWQRAISGLCCLKILDPIQRGLNSRIMPSLTSCMSSLAQANSVADDEKIKLLNEVDRTGSTLLSASFVTNPHQGWTSRLLTDHDAQLTTFLHLTVACQFDFYVKRKLETIPVSTEQKELLNDLFRFALLRFGPSGKLSIFSHSDPSMPIIQTILAHGADPNIAMTTRAVGDSNGSTLWKDVAKRHQSRPELIALLRQHGANIQEENRKKGSSAVLAKRKKREMLLPWLYWSTA
ncbi:hypothetical protein NA56DRAFT_611964 [Hyaloscypha hepaticicola]|uniref:NACHT domain-containing protein n=1 Tax=Hyaloscypha hepaticicola TaxID=2082293 RepID=A0A2J6PHS2_9HELO|nr:hypothetical protein NA56DRAFT_611964 [Hyaloscypha hepaticicola]